MVRGAENDILMISTRSNLSFRVLLLGGWTTGPCAPLKPDLLLRQDPLLLLL